MVSIEILQGGILVAIIAAVLFVAFNFRKYVQQRNREREAERIERAGLRNGGYIVFDLVDEQRTLFCEYLKGFETYAVLKGYTVHVSFDLSTPNKIAFKFTVGDGGINRPADAVKRDVMEYANRFGKNRPFDDMPEVIPHEEHVRRLAEIEARVEFIEKAYGGLEPNRSNYKRILSKFMPDSNGIENAVNLNLNLGGYMNGNVNSPKSIAGNNNQLIDASNGGTISIGNSYAEKKKQIETLEDAISTFDSVPQSEEAETAKRCFQNVKEELTEVPSPDPSRISRWLERAKHALAVANVGADLATKTAEVFAKFGIGN